ncbi:MAG: hypothetical protein ACHQT8_01600 [Chlamydiales bacterium]
MASRAESPSFFSPLTLWLISMPVGAGVGALLAPIMTTASMAGGAICGGLFVGTTLFTIVVLNRTCMQGREYRIMRLVLGIIAAHLAGMLIPTLMGFPVTFSAAAKIDFSIFGVLLGIICGRVCAHGVW